MLTHFVATSIRLIVIVHAVICVEKLGRTCKQGYL